MCIGPAGLAMAQDYLCLDHDLSQIVSTFPDDEPLRVAVAACRGLRLLKQDPWECLASFICSSSKQIVQIEQIVANLCDQYGIVLPADSACEWNSFPPAQRLAACDETELRECKMGYRAPYILGSAQMIRDGEIDLDSLAEMHCADARRELMRLPGVGRKVADCVLLFAYGFQDAFPIDVWIGRGLRELYFPRRKPTRKRLLEFTENHFGPYAGYAQQYLFHYVRTIKEKDMSTSIEVTFTPAEFNALRERDLNETACVVFDVLRATTSMTVALANGAEAVIPVETIGDAVTIKNARPEVLLAGEQGRIRILAAQSGGIDFDLGNSPREYTEEAVSGRTIVSTTTNGTCFAGVRRCEAHLDRQHVESAYGGELA